MLALSTAGWAHERSQRSAAELMDVLMWNREAIGGPFTLTDHLGKRRTDADYRGKVLLVYFGFMSCADVCPTDLQQIGKAVDSLGPGGDAVQPLFITLDPARDTPGRLAAYVSAFHPRLAGLTGTSKEIAAVADAYRVYHRIVQTGKNGDYTVDHSAAIYLMDRQGKYLGFMPPGTPAERIVQAIRPLLRAP